MPYIKSIAIIESEQLVASVVVEREETIVHGDIFPHFEGKQYRSLGAMSLVDGKDWKANGRGVEERTVEVGVVPVEPDGTSFIKMRFSSSLLGRWWDDKVEWRKAELLPEATVEAIKQTIRQQRKRKKRKRK